jgi:hypothetical protein
MAEQKENSNNLFIQTAAKSLLEAGAQQGWRWLARHGLSHQDSKQSSWHKWEASNPLSTLSLQNPKADTSSLSAESDGTSSLIW